MSHSSKNPKTAGETKRGMKRSGMVLDFSLHPKQGVAFGSEATEILYGGAAGGGKSHLMRVAAIVWSVQIPHLQTYLFRRTFPDLIKNHMEGPTGFRALLAHWVRRKACQITEREVRFSNGSKIYLCHCQNDEDRFNYLGDEMHVLMMDELTMFSEVIYQFLRSRVRIPGQLEIPSSYPQGFFPRILCSSNPGGIGHLWVKKAWIDGRPPLEIEKMADVDGGMKRQFIPAKLEDNPTLALGDLTYEAKLSGLGTPELVKAMRDGDWRVIQGAYFPEFKTDRHVIKPFSIPDGWLKFRAFDWGSAKPFSVGWWAVSNGEGVIGPDGKEVCYPRGAMIKYREWYGKSDVDKGLRMRNEDIAIGIISRENGTQETIHYSVADPSIFKQEGGPPIAEQFKMNGVNFRPADNKRLPGWQQLRSRLIGEEGRPMIYFFETCVDSIRTIPALQYSTRDVEDLDTHAEDHAADETRYACMSRSFVQKPDKKSKKRSWWDRSLNELWSGQEKDGYGALRRI